jgi:hypothetical protein
MPMNNESDRKGSAALRGRAKKGAFRSGGTIPSPQQMTLQEARERALMGRPEMAPMLPQEPRISDIPNMSTEEIAPYNRPAPDINDAFFGDFNFIDYLRNFGRGR